MKKKFDGGINICVLSSHYSEECGPEDMVGSRRRLASASYSPGLGELVKTLGYFADRGLGRSMGKTRPGSSPEKSGLSPYPPPYPEASSRLDVVRLLNTMSTSCFYGYTVSDYAHHGTEQHG